jgi:hypothetical protein
VASDGTWMDLFHVRALCCLRWWPHGPHETCFYSTGTARVTSFASQAAAQTFDFKVGRLKSLMQINIIDAIWHRAVISAIFRLLSVCLIFVAFRACFWSSVIGKVITSRIRAIRCGFSAILSSCDLVSPISIFRLSYSLKSSSLVRLYLLLLSAKLSNTRLFVRLGAGHLPEPMAGIDASWACEGPLRVLRWDNQEVIENETVGCWTCPLNRHP